MIFVVTDPEMGWDCLCGVYEASSEDAVRSHLAKRWAVSVEELNVVITQTVVEKIKTDSEIRDQKIDNIIDDEVSPLNRF